MGCLFFFLLGNSLIIPAELIANGHISLDYQVLQKSLKYPQHVLASVTVLYMSYIQVFISLHTRVIVAECLRGDVEAGNATAFPQAIGLAATFE